MQNYEFEQKRISMDIQLSNNELIILSNMFLDLKFPYNSLTLKDAIKILKCTKPTASKIMESLIKKGCLTKCSGFINFYYPVKDTPLRAIVLERLGFK